MAKYGEKLKPILDDVSNKEIDLAGGSVVGIVLSTTNSLIDYICNLTIGKKKYEDVQDEVLEIKKYAQKLKEETLNYIDQDKEILEKILSTYKMRKENPKEYETVNKKAVEFCLEVTEKAVETLKLVDRLSKVGNKMLESDFKICKYYGFASVEASIVNIEVNLKSVSDEKYIQEIRKRYGKNYQLAKDIMNI